MSKAVDIAVPCSSLLREDTVQAAEFVRGWGMDRRILNLGAFAGPISLNRVYGLVVYASSTKYSNHPDVTNPRGYASQRSKVRVLAEDAPLVGWL